MEAKPILIIEGSKPMSTSKARKALKKFLSTAEESQATPSISTLPDDVLQKLSVLVESLAGDEADVSADNIVVSKKRKSVESAAEVPEKKLKKEKKDKKEKKERKEAVATAPASHVAGDEKLLKMKQALKKKQ
jgi:hypothetical protein